MAAAAPTEAQASEAASHRTALETLQEEMSTRLKQAEDSKAAEVAKAVARAAASAKVTESAKGGNTSLTVSFWC